MQNLKKYLKEELDPKNYKEEIAKLSKVVKYEIDLTMDDDAINRLVNATKTMLKIKKGQLEIKVTGVKESIGTFLKTTLKQKRKDLPS
jgi:hypothetical protein